MNDEAPTTPEDRRRPPRLTDGLRARARQAPGSWIYAIERGYDTDGGVPPHAVIGAWPVDQRGEPGDFTFNPEHRPPPRTPVPIHPTEPVAVRDAVGGQAGHETVLHALRGATVYLPADAEGGPLAYRDDDGGTYVEVVTAPRYAPVGAPRLLPVRLPDLAALLPGDTDLRIRVDRELSLRIPGDELRATPTADEPAPTAAPGPPAPRPGTPLPGIPVKGRPPDAGRTELRP